MILLPWLDLTLVVPRPPDAFDHHSFHHHHADDCFQNARVPLPSSTHHDAKHVGLLETHYLQRQSSDVLPYVSLIPVFTITMAPPPFAIMSHRQKWLQYGDYMSTLERAAWNKHGDLVERADKMAEKIDNMQTEERWLESIILQAVHDRNQRVFQNFRRAIPRLRQKIREKKQQLVELKRRVTEAEAAHAAALPPEDLRQSLGYERFVGY